MKKYIIIFFITFFILLISGIWFVKFFLPSYNKDIIVVVRSVGERTEQICVKKLQKIFGEENVVLIKNVTPLYNATQKTYETGLSSGKKWMLVVDADVLLFDDKIKLFILNSKFRKFFDRKAFMYQAFLYDKFFCKFRNKKAGHYLIYLPNFVSYNKYFYTCKNLTRVEACIRDSIIVHENKNYYVTPDLIGIHDFFQYPDDIVRKFMLYSLKLDDDLQHLLEYQNNDEDFKWARLGIKMHKDINRSYFIPDAQYFNEISKKYNLPKKTLEELSEDSVEKILKQYNTQNKRIFKFYKVSKVFTEDNLNKIIQKLK